MISATIKKILTFSLLTIFIISKSLAQDFYKGNPWILNYSLNVVIEDLGQFKGYFNNTPIVWNLSPFNFCAEKRLNYGTAVNFSINNSLYPINQQIDGQKLRKPQDVFSIETGLKFNLLQLIKESHKFDPFIEVNTGIWSVSYNTLPFIGAGFGFNYWFSNTIGLRANFQQKFILASEHTKSANNGLQLIGLGILHIVN